MDSTHKQHTTYEDASRDLLNRLDSLPLGKPHYRIRRLGGFGYLFDTFDGTLMGYAMAAVIALWSIDEGTAGILLASVFVGYLVGALGAGVLADRFGRRKLMMIALAAFSIFSLLMATAQSPTELFIWRALAGIGLGAESVLVTPYLSEFVPPKHRSTFIGRTVAYFSYGSVLAALVALLVIGPNADTWWGWRVAGLIAVLPIGVLLLLRRDLPESPRFLLARGRIAEAEEVVLSFEKAAGVTPAPPLSGQLTGEATGTITQVNPAGGIGSQIKMLFAKGMVRRTLTIWLLWFTLTGVNYGFTSWMVNLLISAKGFSVGGSFAFALVTSSAQIPGYLFAAWLAGKFEKKWVVAAYAAGACISALGVALAPNTGLLLLSAALLASFINGAAAAYYPYTAELYPTSARTTGVGFASAVGRIGAIASPIAIGFVFAAYGFEVVFLGLVGVLAIAVILILAFGERTGGKSLEEIEGATL